MAVWTGIMQTAKLNDQQIRPTEYRRWDNARRQFARGRDRDTVDAYKAEISGNSGRLTTPIRLQIDDRTNRVSIGDGHHRAVALLELGVGEFDFTWGWRRAFSNTTEHRPFPSEVLP